MGFPHLDLVVWAPDTLPIEIEDGSGDIDVTGVGGNFVLLLDGSGSVRYADVAGTAEVP